MIPTIYIYIYKRIWFTLNVNAFLFAISVNCPAGYQFNNDTKACIACPIGSYQDKIGDYPCIKCPKHFLTAQNASSKESDCSVCK